jgi:IclR family acetate operon transcriptional repressor
VLAEASSDGLPLTEIGQRSGLAYSTTYRILETLRRRKFVYQSAESGVYSIGLRAFQIGTAFSAQHQWYQVANAALKSLVEDVNETTSLGILDGSEVVNIHQVEGTRLMRMFIQPGSRLSLHGTGIGKALLAWLEPGQVLDLLGSGPWPSHTEKTITEPGRFLEELAAIRERGYSLDDEEQEVGVRCIAAPVQDLRGRVVAAVSIAGPKARLCAERLDDLSERVIAAAQLVATNLT